MNYIENMPSGSGRTTIEMDILIASRVKLKIGSVTLVGVALRTAVLDSQTLKQLKSHYVPKYQRLALLECV